MVALPIWPINHKIDNMDEVLVAKLGKSDNKCSDASLGAQKVTLQFLFSKQVLC